MLPHCSEMVTHPNILKHQATASDREVMDTAIRGISKSGMSLELSKKMNVFFYTAKTIVITTEKAEL